MQLLIVAVASLAVSVAAAPTSSYHVVHEKRDVSTTWIKRDPLDADVVLPMRIGLTQSNIDKGHDMLMAVSHPHSPDYGKHYTSEEVHDIFAPSQASVGAVQDWLILAGIGTDRVSLSTNKQWLQFDATASEVNDLLQTQCHSYEHTSSSKMSVACEDYSVPSNVQKHIDYITPGVKLLASSSKKPSDSDIEKRTFGWGKGKPHGPPKKPLPMPWNKIVTSVQKDSELDICDVAITPACIFALYNITQPTKHAAGNQLGIFEDLADVYSQDDLNLYFNSLAPQIPQGTHPLLKAVDGAVAPTAETNAGPESDLDFQISYPIIWPQNSVLFQTDDPVYEQNYNYIGFFNNFLDAIDGSYCTYSAFGETGNSIIDPPYPHPVPGGYNASLQCGVYKPTNVISISYGGEEAGLPASYQKRQCNEFMRLGLQGVSVVLSSGDSGVSGPSSSCLGPSDNIFNPDSAANCPYVTAVGATFLPNDASVTRDEEVAVQRFASGGGFSNVYPIPSYQKNAVASYFRDHNPLYKYYSAVDFFGVAVNGGVYNRVGRGYPDVAAVGDNIVIFNKGTATLIGGTSASAPVFAAILNRINEERIAKGKRTIGFVNPVLYSHPGVLRDITSGSNPGCGTNGFSASIGWDPVTGLGTPDYPKMLSLFMSLS